MSTEEKKNSDGAKDWQYGICGCFNNVPWCLITSCLPVLTLYTVAKRVEAFGLGRALVGLWVAIGILVVASGVAEQMALASMQTDGAAPDDPMAALSSSVVALIISVLLLVAAVAALICEIKLRTTVRERYNIAGSGCKDAYVVCCYCCFHQCQMYNQTEHEMQNNPNISRA